MWWTQGWNVTPGHQSATHVALCTYFLSSGPVKVFWWILHFIELAPYNQFGPHFSIILNWTSVRFRFKHRFRTGHSGSSSSFPNSFLQFSMWFFVLKHCLAVAENSTAALKIIASIMPNWLAFLNLITWTKIALTHLDQNTAAGYPEHCSLISGMFLSSWLVRNHSLCGMQSLPAPTTLWLVPVQYIFL
jgi:hypothetical protein